MVAEGVCLSNATLADHRGTETPGALRRKPARHRRLTIIAFLSRRLRAMLYQIPSFLLDVLVGLLGGACLLRLYMQYHRVPFGNPLGRFVFAVSDWIVMPLRRVVPSVKRWDLASLIAAWLLVLAKFVLLALLIGSLGRMAILPLVSLVGLAQLAVSGLTALLVVYAVLSWVPGASSVLLDLVSRLAEPIVRPLRRIIPLVGGVDLSALAAIVLLQVVAIALGSLMGTVWALGR
jgi:YggT family protein